MLGIIIAIGLLVRLALGIGLFAISYYHWPILPSLQAGDGFWVLAPDARVYFAIAREAAIHAASVPPGGPSPAYSLALSLWMRAAGATLPCAVAFNALCYFVAAVALVAVAGRSTGPWLTAALFSISFSPALILTSTQVLKDPLFLLLIVLGAIAAFSILRCSRRSLLEQPYGLIGGIALAAVSIAAIGGIRAYYATFMWAAIAVALAVSAWTHETGRRLPFVAFGVVLLMFLWGAFILGSGAYYPYYGRLLTKVIGVQIPILSGANVPNASVRLGGTDVGELAATLMVAREGFIGSGGGTGLVKARSRTTRQSAREWISDLGVGVAAVYVPISILRATSLVSFNGGRGFLALTDIDTLFLDATILVVFVTLWRWRATVRRNAPAALFFVVLTLISVTVVAYVVTNFGTLFRLRLMIAAPIWMSLVMLADDCATTLTGPRKSIPVFDDTAD